VRRFNGLLHETSAEDLSMISKSVVAAYNSAYSATGYSFTAGHHGVSLWPGHGRLRVELLAGLPGNPMTMRSPTSTPMRRHSSSL
jgi:hypothetical protein